MPVLVGAMGMIKKGTEKNIMIPGSPSLYEI